MYIEKIKSPKVKGFKKGQKLTQKCKKNHNYEIYDQLRSP